MDRQPKQCPFDQQLVPEGYAVEQRSWTRLHRTTSSLAQHPTTSCLRHTFHVEAQRSTMAPCIAAATAVYMIETAHPQSQHHRIDDHDAIPAQLP